VTISDDADGVIRGVFKTVLAGSSFFRREVPVHGAAYGDVVGWRAFGTSLDTFERID